MEKHKHLDFTARCEIQSGLSNSLSFKEIGRQISKDCTTVSKEVKGRRVVLKSGAYGKPFNDCIHRRECTRESGELCANCKSRKTKCSFCNVGCAKNCPEYEKETCSRLSKAPYVCNGCKSKPKCTLEKFVYDAIKAQKEYHYVLSDARSGLAIDKDEIAELDDVLTPLLKNGQSVHHIMSNNADRINFCEKTIYTYVGQGLFEARNIDMPRRVRFRPRKAKSVPLKVDKACRSGRTYEDFLEFIREHPDLSVVELDSVEGKKGGAVLLTVHFVRQKFQLAFKRDHNDSASVTAVFRDLYEKLGREAYIRLFPVLLCDNGSEFSNPSALEFDSEGNRLSHVFYCHPSAPNEKGACENNHEFIRRVIPKGADIGRFTQPQIRTMMSHINSYSRADLGNKSPYAMMRFYYGRKIVDLLGIKFVEPNDIVLRSSLLSTEGKPACARP